MTIPSELVSVDYAEILVAVYPFYNTRYFLDRNPGHVEGRDIIKDMADNVDTWEDLNTFVCQRTNDILNGDYLEEACNESGTFKRVFTMYLKEIKTESYADPVMDARSIYDAFKILNG